MFELKLKGPGLKPLNTRWWKPTQNEWAPVLLKDHQVPWRQQSDPTTGRPWAALSDKYATWKKKKWPGSPILRLTGEMQDTAIIKPKGEGFSVTSKYYGVYNQFGTSKMPARPWVGIPDDSLKKIVPIAWKNILS